MCLWFTYHASKQNKILIITFCDFMYTTVISRTAQIQAVVGWEGKTLISQYCGLKHCKLLEAAVKFQEY